MNVVMALAWHLSNVAAYADDRKRSERLWREGIVEARDAGATLAEIAAAAGVTDGRIWQICNETCNDAKNKGGA